MNDAPAQDPKQPAVPPRLRVGSACLSQLGQHRTWSAFAMRLALSD